MTSMSCAGSQRPLAAIASKQASWGQASKRRPWHEAQNTFPEEGRLRSSPIAICVHKRYENTHTYIQQYMCPGPSQHHRPRRRWRPRAAAPPPRAGWRGWPAWRLQRWWQSVPPVSKRIQIVISITSGNYRPVGSKKQNTYAGALQPSNV